MFNDAIDTLGTRQATLARLAVLAGLVYWQIADLIQAHHHGAVRDGASLALLVAVAVAWSTWAWRYEHGGRVETVPVHLVVLGVCGGALLGLSPNGPAIVVVFMVAFVAGAQLGRDRGLAVTAVAILAVEATWIPSHQGLLGALAYPLGMLATCFGGIGRYETILRREQAELLLAQTQRSQEEALRAAKLEESARIAREIHDVLAHSLAGLTIQLEATAAMIEAGADPAVVLDRVRRAHALARDGMRETRLAVGALRGDAAPLPAVSRIEALVADLRASGATVELELDGDGALDGPVGDAAVRILQESLTNVAKHAPGARVQVRLGAGPPASLSVLSTGGTASGSLAHAGGGYGITGMRERAAALGGHLEAGPVPGGWRVEARLGTPA